MTARRRTAHRVLALLALSGSLFGGVAAAAVATDDAPSSVEAGRTWHKLLP